MIQNDSTESIIVRHEKFKFLSILDWVHRRDNLPKKVYKKKSLINCVTIYKLGALGTFLPRVITKKKLTLICYRTSYTKIRS